MLAVLFDVDGVLLDSLGPHLKICEDLNRTYGLGLTIPSPADFKRRVIREGIRISPMKTFFMAVGFPEPVAERADAHYQTVFMREYAPKPFPATHRTLQALHQAELQLGIITSNVRKNVVEALGQSMTFFHPEVILTRDSREGSSKVEMLTTALTALRVPAAETLFVGDLVSDWEAAKATGVNFLGAAYGWGISEADNRFPIVTDVSEIETHIRGLQVGDGY